MSPLVAVDIGNSFLHAQLFVPTAAAAVMVGDASPQTAQQPADLERLPADVPWVIASVNRERCLALREWLERRNAVSVEITYGDIPLDVQLPPPLTTGIDRLVAAVAANRLRSPERPAIVIDSGTATTVDVLDRSGAFRGGAIVAGARIAAQALAQQTDALPLLESPETPPPALGLSTVTAMNSGAYWGALGAVRELVSRLTAELNEGEPDLFVTGGGAIWAQPLCARHIPNLTLCGVAAVAEHLDRSGAAPWR